MLRLNVTLNLSNSNPQFLQLSTTEILSVQVTILTVLKSEVYLFLPVIFFYFPDSYNISIENNQKTAEFQLNLW